VNCFVAGAPRNDGLLEPAGAMSPDCRTALLSAIAGEP
jgi:hypothetical protein